MGKRKKASDSIDTFLTLMRTLEIVIMNRADFAKRQLENVEGRLSRYRTVALELSSNCSPLLAFITANSHLVPAVIMQYVNEGKTDFVGEVVPSQYAEIMKMSKEKVGDAINRVYRAPLLTSSSNPSSDLCGDFFKTFELLESEVEYLGKFECNMESWLREIGNYMVTLMQVGLTLYSIVNSPSADHNNNETAGT